MQFSTLFTIGAMFTAALASPTVSARGVTAGAVTVQEVPKAITEGAAAYAAKLNGTSLDKRANVGVFLCVCDLFDLIYR